MNTQRSVLRTLGMLAITLLLITAVVPPAPAQEVTAGIAPHQEAHDALDAPGLPSDVGSPSTSGDAEAPAPEGLQLGPSEKVSLQIPGALPRNDLLPYDDNWTQGYPNPAGAYIALAQESNSSSSENRTPEPTDEPGCEDRGNLWNTGCYGMHDVERVEDGPLGNDFAVTTRTNPDGSLVYVTGSMRGNASTEIPYDVVTIAYDADTYQEVWRHRYDGLLHEYDVPLEMQVGPEGQRVYLALSSWDGYPGETYGPDNRSGDWWDIVTLSLDAHTGQVLWEDRYHGESEGGAVATDIAVSPDGSRVVTSGNTASTSNSLDMVGIVHDAATGDRLRKVLYDGPGHHYDAALATTFAGDDTIVLAGLERGDGADRASESIDLAAVAYDVTTGELLWKTWFDEPDWGWSVQGDLASDIAASPDGDTVYISGLVDAFLGTTDNTAQQFVRAVDATTGTTTWQWRGELGHEPTGVTYLRVSPDGERVAFAGLGTNIAEGYNFHAAAFDASTGAILWNNTYNSARTQPDLPADATLSPDGSRLYITGGVVTAMDSRRRNTVDESSTKVDYVTVGYDMDDGRELFRYRYDGSNLEVDVPAGITTSADGSDVIVTGSTCEPTGPSCLWSSNRRYDYSTIVYDITTAPSAELTATPSTGQAPTTVTFNLTASDPEGQLSSWALDADGDGEPDHEGLGAPPATVQHTYLDGGSLDATLRVNDTSGAVATATAHLELAHPAPDAGFNVEPATPLTLSPATLSSTSVGDLTSWSWSFGDGSTATGQEVQHAFASPGTYTVELTVTDTQGRTSTTSQSVTVLNRDPAADVTFTPVHPQPGDTVTLTAHAGDEDGSVAALDWDLPDGSTDAGSTASYTPLEEGTFPVHLTVTDDAGATTTTTALVQVGTATGSDAARADPACQNVLDTCVEWHREHTTQHRIDYRYEVARPPTVESVTSPGGATVYNIRTVRGTTLGDTDVRVTATTAVSGEELWTRTLDAPTGWIAGSRGLDVSPDGATVFVTARTWTMDHVEDSLRGYDATTWGLHASTGRPIWESTYDGPEGEFDSTWDLDANPAGSSVAVIASSRGNHSYTDVVTLVYDADTGKELWRNRSMRFDRLYPFVDVRDQAWTLTHSADGSTLFTLARTDRVLSYAVEEWDSTVAARDATTGRTLWEERVITFEDGFFNSHPPADLRVDGRGDRLFLAYEDEHSNDDLRAFDQGTGDTLWTHETIAGTGTDPALGVSPTGSIVYLAAPLNAAEQKVRGDYDIRTWAVYANNGTVRWNSIYNSNQGDDMVKDIAVSPGGTQVYLLNEIMEGAGHWSYSVSSRTQHATLETVALGTGHGEALWSDRYDTGPLSSDMGFDVTTSPRGDYLMVDGVSETTGYVARNLFVTLLPDTELTALTPTGRAPFTAGFGLDASDPDGSIASWSLDADGDGAPDASGSGAPPSTVNHTYTKLGTYTATLTVGDDEGAEATATAAVEVLPPFPQASFTRTPTYPGVDETVSFTDTSFSVGGNATWSFGDGSSTTVPVGSTVTHAYGDAGFYTVTLQVTDVYDQTDVATATVQVGNEAPKPAFQLQPEHAIAGRSISFHEYANDLDGTIASYTWSFGDGTTATGPDVTHTFDAAGTYDVSLTVTDNEGAVKTLTEPLTVHGSSVTGPDCDPATGTCATWEHGNGYLVETSLDGSTLYLAGTDGERLPHQDIVLRARNDRTGAIQWDLTYAGPHGGADFPVDLALSPDGSTLYVAGSTEEPDGSWELMLMAVDTATGTIGWTSRWDSVDLSYETEDIPRALALSDDGSRLHLVGQTERDDLVVWTVDAATGTDLWTVETDDVHIAGLNSTDPNNTAAALDVEAVDGRVHVAGWTKVEGDVKGYTVLALDGVTGDRDWAFTDTWGTWGYTASEVEVSSDGSRVYAGGTGFESTNSGREGVLLALDASSGEVVWDHHVDEEGNARLEDMTLSPRDDLLVATGTMNGTPNNYPDALTVGIDPATGQEVWRHTVDNDGGEDYGYDVAVSPDGSRVAVLTQSYLDPSVTHLLTSQGEELWVHEASGGAPWLKGDSTFDPTGRHLIAARAIMLNGVVSSSLQPVVLPVSLPPTAAFEPELRRQALDLPVAFQVDATDPDDGSIASWSLDANGDGTPEASGDGTPPATVPVGYAAAGTHTANLRLVDGQGGVSTVRTWVTIVENAPPTVDVPDPVSVVAGTLAEVTFNATDPDGDTVTWTVSESDPLENVQAAVDGNGDLTWTWSPPLTRVEDVTLTLTASDAFHDVTREVVVDVQALPTSTVLEPLARGSGITSDIVILSEDTLLRGLATDPDASVAQATFFPEGPGGPSVNATVADGVATAPYAWPAAGTYEVLLSVEDEQGLVANSTRTVQVVANTAPVADAGDDAARDAPGEVRLDATGSLDPEGRDLTYTWSLPDGTMLQGSTATWQAPAGVHTVDLTVTDSLGATGTDAVTVTVDDALVATVERLGDGSVDVRERPTLAVEVTDDTGALRAGANVTVEVEHAASTTAGTTVVTGTTGSDGRLLVRIPYDVEEGNVPGEHTVTVTVDDASRAGAPDAGTETATAGLTYQVR